MTIRSDSVVVDIKVHHAIIDFGPELGKRVFQATVTWAGHGIVAEPQGDNIPQLLQRVADAVAAAGKTFV